MAAAMVTAVMFRSVSIKAFHSSQQFLSSCKRLGSLEYLEYLEQRDGAVKPNLFTRLAQFAHNSQEIRMLIQEAEKRWGKQLDYILLGAAALRATQLNDNELAMALVRRVPKVHIPKVHNVLLRVLSITDGKKLIEDLIASPVPRSMDIVGLCSLLQFCERCVDVELAKRIWAWAKVVRDSNPKKVSPIMVYLMLCGKTGDMKVVKQVWDEAVSAGFNSRPEVTGAMLSVLAAHGDVGQVDQILSQVPDHQVSEHMLSSALTAYSHNGLAKEAWNFLKKIESVSGRTVVGIYAYSTVIDAFARKGDFQSALDVIEKMKERGLNPDTVIWTAILSPCRQYKELPTALQAFEAIKELNSSPEDVASAYVLMADVYKACGNSVAAAALQEERLSRGLVKERGAVTTTVHGKTYTFHVDEIPVELAEAAPSIQAKLDEWSAWLVSQGVSIESIECRHSEKLALAYAVNQKEKTVILRKNLRVCTACHRASVQITKFEGITIHHWDRSRLHIMKDGRCSCGDYY